MIKKEVIDKYKNNHDINIIISDLKNFDSYSDYQFLIRELIDYIDFLEKLLEEAK
jgi:hypothetical protein